MHLSKSDAVRCTDSGGSLLLTKEVDKSMKQAALTHDVSKARHGMVVVGSAGHKMGVLVLVGWSVERSPRDGRSIHNACKRLVHG
jgi:hypothetical protein